MAQYPTTPEPLQLYGETDALLVAKSITEHNTYSLAIDQYNDSNETQVATIAMPKSGISVLAKQPIPDRVKGDEKNLRDLFGLVTLVRPNPSLKLTEPNGTWARINAYLRPEFPSYYVSFFNTLSLQHRVAILTLVYRTRQAPQSIVGLCLIEYQSRIQVPITVDDVMIYVDSSELTPTPYSEFEWVANKLVGL